MREGNERLSKASVLWQELHANYYNLVFGLALKSTQNYEDAEDLTQEVFLKMFRRLNQGIPAVLEHPDDMIKWMSAVTRNAAIDFYRTKQREVQVIPLADLKFPSGNPIELPTIEIEQPPRINLDACGLTERQKKVIEACYFEGLSNQAYADRVGRSLGTVKATLFRARQKIAAAVRENPDIIIEK